MKSLREAFKFIRKSKSLTIEKVASGVMSISQVSRFENGQNDILTHHFLALLKNMNTSIDEFFYLQREGESTEEENTLEQIRLLIAKHDAKGLTYLFNELEKNRQNDYSLSFFLAQFCKLILVLWSDGTDEASMEVIAQPVLEYLFMVNDWGEFELLLYDMFGFAFQVDTTYRLMHTAIKRSRQYRGLSRDQYLMNMILNANFSTFISKGRLDFASDTLKVSESILDDTIEIFPHIYFLFNKGIYKIKKGDIENGMRQSQQAISICASLRQKKLEELLKIRLQNWLENGQNPDFRDFFM
ncbi:helix-turn-helix domain-containing protein [Sporolactobacillus shoreicorticis]|uniref:Helix-turn-helix domain-containing protein n=1 Tax=Sporolactobacillus shoreicorticis TaxID=1923877 RepID=A0ABW5S6C8_9BACL|nr:Rgg/GadR/MutR family transcriptional regulator [Sporolactobacillus shoreicorticis]MCO7127356.1 helix-turn-helix domain-containing protein [Sporolactobacillus shoreicorticis]